MASDPKPTPENTISIQLSEVVKPQTFPRPLKFFVEDVIDRSGNPRPQLVFQGRGGIFIDRQPTEIVRQALTDSLSGAGLLAADRASANFVLTVYLFHFGLSSGSGGEYYGKVDLNVVVKDPAAGKSETITALGTSIQGLAFRKKTRMKNVAENIEEALQAALRNFLRSTKLRDAVAAGDAGPAGASEGSPRNLLSGLREGIINSLNARAAGL